MQILDINLSMKDDLQELINSVKYISKYSGCINIRTAEEEIINPEVPTNGKKESSKIKCIYQNNEMINYCEYYQGYEDQETIFLGGFYIKKDKQNSGFGRKILGLYEDKWKSEGIKRIILQVDIKNWIGLRFWYNNGYDKIIKWIGDSEYSENTYAMLRLEKII